MNTLYTASTFPGDEDTGSMAAWYVLSALGFYQLCPGKPEYTFGSPLFPRATVHLPHGKTLVVEAGGNTLESFRVKNVSFGGKPVTGPTILHADLVSGGELQFTMGV